jgi:hypothetical protein
MKRSAQFGSLFALLLLAGCVTVPNGPSGMALPGTGRGFEQFRDDNYECRQYASGQSGISPNQAAENSGIKSAAVGTVVGAAAGAAMGGSHGATIGAGTGLLVGSLAGTGAANASAYGAQQRYDAAYMQCMYAKGHRIPVSGRFSSQSPRRGAYSAPPPPPPGYYGAPPPPAYYR